MDTFIEALEELQEAKRDYDEKCKTCMYDRDYFLHQEIHRIKDAKESLENIFQTEVRRIVVDVINKKSYLPQ